MPKGMDKGAESAVRKLEDLSSLEDQATVSKLNDLVNAAKESSCLKALEEFGEDVSYLTDPSRMAYMGVIDIQKDHDVLEIGSSMGQHTRVIAKKCNHVSSLEVVLQQAQFQEVWLREEGIDNVDISAGGASGKLPYDDASFDLVICNYVLEWCAGRSEESAAEFHKSYLKEIARVLKPGGTLFVSTKNRYAIRYVLGSVDEHLGIPFGNALPRLLQKPFRKRTDLGHPVGFLHSWGKLDSILRNAGFSSTERVLQFPDARYPLYTGDFSSFDRGSLPADKVDKLGWKNKLSLSLPKALFASTTNSLVFKATK